MTITQLYLLFTVVPNLQVLTEIIGILGGIVLLFALIPKFIAAGSEHTSDEFKTALNKFFKIGVPIVTISLIATCLLPSTQQIALIISGNYVTNNETLAGIPSKSLELLNKYLDEALEKK